MKLLKASFLILLVAMFASCGKKSTGNATPNNPPTGLDMKSAVSTDASGNVTFTATATNVVSYEFDFGNGIYQTSTSGSVTYKYPAEGTYTVKVTAKSSTGQTAVKTIQVNISLTSTGGDGTIPAGVTWSEEFNTDGKPNPALWGYDLGNNAGWGNNELEYYTDREDNAIVSGGTLKIKLKKEAYMGFNYTSARILTLNKFSFKYGKIEIRAKMPAGSGTWPAIWAMGDDIATNPWPGCGEIDITEHLGRDLNKIYGTVHYPGHSGGNSVGGSTLISNATTEFHRYGLDWSATSIKFMVDDVVYFTVANDNSLPFNHKFFIILNVAMGGDFGGAVDPAFNNGQMEVDYVRLSQ